jgi:hypothetical protein
MPHLDQYRFYRSDYYTAAQTINSAFPELLKDPVIASAILMFKQHELIIAARMTELAEEADKE